VWHCHLMEFLSTLNDVKDIVARLQWHPNINIREKF